MFYYKTRFSKKAVFFEKTAKKNICILLQKVSVVSIPVSIFVPYNITIQEKIFDKLKKC